MSRNIEQGTPEWHEMRKNKIGASDAAPILCVSPFKTPFQLFEEKLGLRETANSPAIQRGNELEPIARTKFEHAFGLEVKPRVLVHPEYSWMMASLDGISANGDVAVEIKCPGKASHLMAIEGKVPLHYMAQLQHQMAVAGIKSMFYYSFDGQEGVGIEVDRDEAYISNMIEKEYQFWKKLQNFDPPDMLESDYVHMSGSDWDYDAYAYLNAKHMRENWEKEEEQHRQRLIEMAQGKSCQGSGVRVSRYFRKGNVDYKSIEMLKDIDLEPYRKPPIESWRITGK